VPNPLQTQLLAQNIRAHVREDFVTLDRDLSVGEAIEVIRKAAAGNPIQYYYVVDRDHKLVGVLPLRRLITFPTDKRLHEVMTARVVAIPWSATVMDACEFFVMHRLLAFPVVDAHRAVIGVVDISQFTTEMVDLGGEARPDEMFEAIGVRLAQVRGASPVAAFRFRFPWLLTTIGSGIVCALLTSAFEVTLAKSIVLTFFLALILGLCESVGIQSMTLTIQSLRSTRPTRRSYLRAVRREMLTAVLLGLASGLLVGTVVWIWRGDPRAALVIGCGIATALLGACFFGLSVPTGLHALKLDPKIAAGPITLGLTDVLTLSVYFGLATAVLR
jgi:magnesium transporter